MFSQFPKVRPPLPPAYQAIYEAHYRSNRQGQTPASSLAQRVEGWLHRQVAADTRTGVSGSTLEIGAGTLNQLPYEPPHAYDIVEPFQGLFQDSPYLSRIRRVFADIREVPVETRYDRITSIATFEHICDLPQVVAHTCLLLTAGGILRTAIPNEGTWLWRLGWQMTTGWEFRQRHGLDYGTLMAHEHVNDADEIEDILQYFYAETTCRCFGLGKRHALYRFYESRNPHLRRAKAFLSTE